MTYNNKKYGKTVRCDHLLHRLGLGFKFRMVQLGLQSVMGIAK